MEIHTDQLRRPTKKPSNFKTELSDYVSNRPVRANVMCSAFHEDGSETEYQLWFTMPQESQNPIKLCLKTFSLNQLTVAETIEKAIYLINQYMHRQKETIQLVAYDQNNQLYELKLAKKNGLPKSLPSLDPKSKLKKYDGLFLKFKPEAVIQKEQNSEKKSPQLKLLLQETQQIKRRQSEQDTQNTASNINIDSNNKVKSLYSTPLIKFFPSQSEEAVNRKEILDDVIIDSKPRRSFWTNLFGCITTTNSSQIRPKQISQPNIHIQPIQPRTNN